ncbi:MAG TPA: VWA domain-containing protein [Candidatus Methylomirabilis sp.]|nr:VWA domain-containing protein [Candidatus Methylomirabilis sp.]
MAQDLVTHVALFAGALRERGIRVGLCDEVDGVSALTLVDLLDRGEVRLALRTALKIRRRDREAFDELFRRFWGGKAADAPHRERPPGRPMAARAAAPLRWGQSQIGGRGEGDSEQDAAAGDAPGYSPEVLLRRKPFDACSPEDLAALEPLLRRLARALATRRSRRRVPTRGRGRVDLRRSFRRAVGMSGELLSLARRERALELPRLVLLCDTSGSMDAHARFLLAFVLSLARVARRTEVFAFNTSLTRLTPWLSPGKIGPTLDRLAAGVPDWSGGTRIGESLAEFTRGYLEETVNAGAVVVILSDGLDRGDTALLVDAMRAIRARARKVIWLNPLLGDPRYEPTARGMEAALPFIDHFCPAHNLESLERLLSLLAA